jgi:hypothetical protein
MTADRSAADWRPGSTASLHRLYDLVPATEEVDLREDLERERVWQWYAVRSHPDFAEPDAQPDEFEGTPAPPTLRQAIGLVEHLLGAVPVDDDPA